MELAGTMAIIGSSAGLLAAALLGTLLAVSNWIRLLAWQRFSTLILQTVATHVPLLWLVSYLGPNFWLLVAWDAAIFAACYISYCAHLTHVHMVQLRELSPSRFSAMGTVDLAAECLASFLYSAVYRAVYTWADVSPQAPTAHARGRIR